MNSLIQQIGAVPAANAAFLGTVLSFVSGMFVALIALGGVLLQIRNQDRRQRKQLEHEVKQKAHDRAMEMKREVFMDVCEGMAAGARYLGKFADVEMAREKHEEIIATVGLKVNRVNVIATHETLECLMAVQEFFVEALTDLGVKRIPVLAKQEKLSGPTRRWINARSFAAS